MSEPFAAARKKQSNLGGFVSAAASNSIPPLVGPDAASRPGGPAASFDHLVRRCLQREWNGEAERLCGLKIDGERELGRLDDRSITLNSTPSNGATPWIAPSWPLPAISARSRTTAVRVTCGAICLSSASHFALMPYSIPVNPVMLPPGRARLATMPLLTGSIT